MSHPAKLKIMFIAVIQLFLFFPVSSFAHANPHAVTSLTQADGTSTVYVNGPAGLTASVEYNPSTSSGSATATTSTLHTDHLGSTSVVTDESGIMIELLDYNP
ncbi:hypothetical protein HZA87_01625, partial [Candidatus Uhrbacteria bacterium]|nr:hypothetical protein [Candidatus Uhrbacteria bacterium]